MPLSNELAPWLLLAAANLVAAAPLLARSRRGWKGPLLHWAAGSFLAFEAFRAIQSALGSVLGGSSGEAASALGFYAETGIRNGSFFWAFALSGLAAFSLSMAAIESVLELRRSRRALGGAGEGGSGDSAGG